MSLHPEEEDLGDSEIDEVSGEDENDEEEDGF
jgi:hypothetical protein